MEEQDINSWSPQKIAYYTSLRNAWNDNNLSAGKSLLSLAAGGIGVLVAVSNFFSFCSIWQIVFWGISVLLFLITVFLIFVLLGCNGKYLDLVIKKCITTDAVLEYKVEISNKILGIYRKLIFILFILAIINAIAFSAISISKKYNQNGENVHAPQKTSTP
jgi:hypothetical protein